MNRRRALSALASAAGLSLVSPRIGARLASSTAMVRPNIVLVVVDDLRYDEFSGGGHTYLETPNIDRLMAEGVSFSSIFHATPLCSPNRATILTGEYASKHGVYGNVSRERLSHELRTITRHLHKAGYETAHVGKWHMGDDPRPRPGYEFWVSFPAQGKIIDPDLWEEGRLHTVAGYITEILTDRAVTFLSRRDRTRPFFLYLGHKAVHPDVIQRDDGSLDLSRGVNYIAAPKYTGRYAHAVFERARSAVGAIAERPMSAMVRYLLEKKATPEILDEFPGVLDPGTSEESIRARAEMMLSVDESMGILLATLRESGDLDDTAVIFTSDNGFFFGEHGLSIERRLPYEEAIRMPLLVRYPPLAKPGGRVAELGSSIDVAPTIADLAALQTPVHMQGQSLKATLDGVSIAHGRKAVLTEYYSHDLPLPWALDADYKCIRTDRYKYIHWIQHPQFDELYDLSNDPLEIRNLIGDSAIAPVLSDLRKELLRLVGESIGLV